MKKAWAALFCAALPLLFPAAASANSGPVRWDGPPSYSVSPVEDCPITVEKEELSFDFSAGIKADWSPGALVTASYTMRNPTSGPLSVRMAFPMIASLSDLSRMEGIRIASDGVDLPYRISVGGAQSLGADSRAYFSGDGALVETALPSFGEILKSVSGPAAGPELLSGSGTLYRFSCAESGPLRVSLDIRGKNAAILTSGVDGFSRDGSELMLEGRSEPDDVLAVLVFGDVSGPEAAAYTEGGGKKSGVAVQTAESKQDAASFLREKLKRSEVYRAHPSEDFLAALTDAAVRAAESTAEAGNAFGDGELYDFLAQNRILILTYEVAFPADGTRQVSVQYPTGGAMDAQQTLSPVYTYGYLLSPAKHWAAFRDLTVRIVPPRETPFVVRSSIPLSGPQGGAYEAKLASLPEKDLTFSLYGSAALTSKAELGQRIFIVLASAAALIAGLFVYARVRRRRKEK